MDNFTKNIQFLNKTLSKIIEKEQKSLDYIEIKPLNELKNAEIKGTETEFYSLLSHFNKEIEIILEQNGPKISEYLEKVQNLADSCFHDKQLLSLQQENRTLKEKIEEISKKANILTAV